MYLYYDEDCKTEYKDVEFIGIFIFKSIIRYLKTWHIIKIISRYYIINMFN